MGQKIRAALHELGTHYDARFTTAVGTAKDAFIVAATEAHDQADEACRAIEDLIGSPNPALDFNALSSDANPRGRLY